jgi:sulfide dehydrogenase cytochrome subunit
MKVQALTVFASLMILGHGIAAADVGTIAANCNGCHGDGGVSKWPDVPTIAGIPAIVQEDALFIYADNARPCAQSKYRQGDTSRAATTMCEVAAGLSEEQIVDIAAHYAELAFVPAKQVFDAAMASTGEAVHKEQCARCHSEGGSNPEDEAGILAGQHMGYLKATIAEFATGDREQPGKMKEKMDLLSPDDVTALLNYYASQQ